VSRVAQTRRFLKAGFTLGGGKLRCLTLNLALQATCLQPLAQGIGRYRVA
jgi:hypothetical protein